MSGFAKLQDTSPEMLDELYKVNMRAPTILTLAAIPHLKRTKGKPLCHTYI